MRRIPIVESGDMRVESEGEDIPEHTHEADEVVYVERERLDNCRGESVPRRLG
jgi:hypothetical protein